MDMHRARHTAPLLLAPIVAAATTTSCAPARAPTCCGAGPATTGVSGEFAGAPLPDAIADGIREAYARLPEGLPWLSQRLPSHFAAAALRDAVLVPRTAPLRAGRVQVLAVGRRAES